MNPTQPTPNFLEPWESVFEGHKDGFKAELQKEMQKEHVLYGYTFEAMGVRRDCDDALFRIKKEGKEAFAVVHLTWSGKPDQFSSYPSTAIYESWEEFEREDMIPTHEDYVA